MRAGPELPSLQPGRRCHRPPGHGRVDDGLTYGRAFEHPDEFLPVDGLQQVAGRTGTQRLEEVLLVVVRAEQDDPPRRIGLDQPAAQVESAGRATQAYVRDHHVRVEGSHQRLSIVGADRLSHDPDPALKASQECFEPFKHHFVVVDQNEPERPVPHDRSV